MVWTGTFSRDISAGITEVKMLQIITNIMINDDGNEENKSQISFSHNLHINFSHNDGTDGQTSC